MARIREKDIVVPALEATAARGGVITVKELIDRIEAYFQPSGEVAEIIHRCNDSIFSQKVRNLVSHRKSSTSMVNMGYAIYHGESESIEITAAGRAFLDQVPEA